MSTRDGSVSSSSSSRQARLARPEARELSGTAGLDTGAGARMRREGSCTASSAPPGLSIAPRRSGQGAVWRDSGRPYFTPLGGHRARWRLGVQGHLESRRGAERGAREPTTARRARVWAQAAGSGGLRRRVGLRAECADSPFGRRLSLDGAGRGRGRGHARPSGRLRPRQPRTLRGARGVAAASAPRRSGAAPRRTPTCPCGLPRGAQASFSAPNARSLPAPPHGS